MKVILLIPLLFLIDRVALILVLNETWLKVFCRLATGRFAPLKLLYFDVPLDFGTFI